MTALRTVVLVQPPLPANERHKRVLPLGLAYLAAFARQRIPGLRLRIVDGQACKLTVPQIAAQVRAEDPGVVGITYWTCQAPAAHALSRLLRETAPGAAIVHGGIHPTIYPSAALETADYCIMHEGEETFVELLRLLAGEGRGPAEIAGLAWRDGREPRLNPPRPYIADLDALPFPAWDLLPMDRYDSPLHVVGGRRLPIIGSRGCPYGCTYCGSPLMWGRRVRWRSPENVLAEMKAAIAALGLTQFHFWDDNLMLDRRHIERLCRLIIEEGLAVRWTGLTRASHIARNGDLMGLLARAGCIGLEVGIESANPETFSRIEKDEDLQVIREVARLHKAHGMSPLFTYMAFNPGETISGYYSQARFIDELVSGLPWYEHFHPMPFPLYTGQFCTPHMGTKLHDEASTLGTVLAERPEEYHHHRINFVPKSLLDDRPARNLPALDLRQYRLCGTALYYSFWDDFNAAVPRERQRETLARYRDSVALFWRLANGDTTIREIGEAIRRRLGVERRQAVRFAAFTALVLGQTGVIVSAVHDAGRRRPVVAVATPAQVEGCLTPAGGEIPLPPVARRVADEIVRLLRRFLG
ncbi:MAG: cobalamin-dependent protein [Candidatus Aureabacteria bacterium]|nr:cobalamin-dependent protein [Candidatus Auribacterota bacterium]